jgi:hypothetical protein
VNFGVTVTGDGQESVVGSKETVTEPLPLGAAVEDTLVALARKDEPPPAPVLPGPAPPPPP